MGLAGPDAHRRGRYRDRYGMALQFGVLRSNRVVSCCYLPLTTAQTRLGALGLGYTVHHDFTPGRDRILMETVTAQVAVAVENAINFRELSELKDRLAEEKLYLESEIRTAWNSQEMVGRVPGLQAHPGTGRDGSSYRCEHPDSWRDRNRQGTDRPRDSSAAARGANGPW